MDSQEKTETKKINRELIDNLDSWRFQLEASKKSIEVSTSNFTIFMKFSEFSDL